MPHADGSQRMPPRRQQQELYLDGVLRAYSPNGIDYEGVYWKSAQVHMSLAKADGMGATMALIHMVTLLLLPLWTGGQRAVLSSTQLVVVCWAVLSTVQLVMLKRNVQLYCRYRHNIVVAIRLLRLASFLVPALNRNFDVMGKWAKPQQHTAGYTLAAYALFSAMCQLQSSCMYTVPTALGVLIQPFGTAAALTWVWSAPPAMHQLPGMQHLATTICNSFRTAFEVVLYVVVDLGAMPGVPAAGFNAFGLSSRCETGMVYAQLLVYAHLLVAFMLPLYIAYIVEFHHKVSFWRSRGVCVIPQRSLLLPFPDNPVLSHVVVCLVSPLLLWFLAEQIAPWLNAVMS